LRFVDTENETPDGKKYGGRALAQLITNMGMTEAPAEEAGDKKDEKTEDKKEEKTEGKKGEPPIVKEPESKESKAAKEEAKKEEEKKSEEAAEEKKEAEAKALKPDNAADKNQLAADNARKEAFETVVSQENDMKEGQDDIKAMHDKATSEAADAKKSNLEAYDYQRRGTAPAARDSMRFVDTESEGLNGDMYGARFSLSQQRNQARLYEAMNTAAVQPAVFRSVESVAP
jgi:flagellar biosynthesis GTPase FlhF